MRSAIAPISALLLSVAILLTGNGLQGILLPIRAQIEAFSTFEIGIMGSAYYLGFAAGCLFTTHLVRLVGHIRAFTAMICVASSVTLVHALLLAPLAWWPLRAVTGFCFAGLYMVIESWLNERATNENRGTIFSIYTIITLTVITCGQLMITLSDPSSFALFCLVGILISIAAVPVALTTAQAPAPISKVEVRLKHIFRMSPVGFVGCLVVGLANGSFWSLGPVFAKDSGMSTAGVAWFMSITVIAGALGQAPLGLASDKTDRRKLIALTCMAASVAGIAMCLFSQLWSLGILISAFFFGAFALPLYSLCVALTNDYASPDEYVEAAIGLLLIFAVGAVIGPLLSSAIMKTVGRVGLFGFSAAVHTAMAAYAIYRIKRREPAPEDERVMFSGAVLSANTLAPLDLGEEQSE